MYKRIISFHSEFFSPVATKYIWLFDKIQYLALLSQNACVRQVGTFYSTSLSSQFWWLNQENILEAIVLCKASLNVNPSQANVP